MTYLVQVADYLKSGKPITADNIASARTAKVIMFPSRKAAVTVEYRRMRLAA